MTWNIVFTNKAEKQVKKLRKSIRTVLLLLINDLKHLGPAPGVSWPNYGKLRGQQQDKRHCHLIKGKPTYVCCWEVICRRDKIIEKYPFHLKMGYLFRG